MLHYKAYLSFLFPPFLDCQRQKLTANARKNTPRIAPKTTPINVLEESSSVISRIKYILSCTGMVWYGNCLFDKINSTLKLNCKYIISESLYITMSGNYTQKTSRALADM